MPRKYARLHEFLQAIQASEWRATFQEIERILGADLPASARKHSAWWSNGGHSQADAWTDAGFETSDVDLPRQTIVFRRSNAAHAGRPAARRKRHHGSTPKTPDRPAKGPPVAPETTALALRGHAFEWIARIEPDAGADGEPVEYMPQKDYAKANQKPLHKHGHGPFCRFTIAGLPEVPGIYAVTVDRRLVYIGIASKSLRQRWSASGYAKIQPVNCYRRGQSTNCKVNNAILRATRKGRAVELWIRADNEPRPLEALLIRELDPPWNDQR